MSKFLRSLIAVFGLASAAVVPQVASAAPVTIDFNAIVTSGTAVGGFYDQSGNCSPGTGEFGCGINFTNAFTFTPVAVQGTVVNNSGCADANCIIELTSDTGFNGSVTLKHAGLGTILVQVFAASDLANAIASASYSGTGSTWTQEPALTFLGTGSVVRISSSGGRASYAIDDITLDLAAVTTSVPEPASFALVALALVGAGATRRRRG